MGLVDMFNAEDRVQVKFSDFYSMMKEGAKLELLLNAVNCDVPHKHIREMVTGNKEPELLKGDALDVLDVQEMFEEDLNLDEYYVADKGSEFVLTIGGYLHVPEKLKADKAVEVGEPLRGYEERVPKSWLEKGYVDLRKTGID
jgi:hypothetical protein